MDDLQERGSAEDPPRQTAAQQAACSPLLQALVARYLRPTAAAPPARNDSAPPAKR